MRAPLLNIFDRVAEALPGWLFMGGGLAILAAALLVPAWSANQQLTWQRDVLQQQAEQLGAQRQRYADCRTGLINMDPLLIERLAYSQLHIQPADCQPWPGLTAPQLAGYPQPFIASIDFELAAPMDRVRSMPWQARKPSRLVRLATGVSRFGLMIAAGVLILAGLMSHPNLHNRQTQRATVAPFPPSVDR